MTSFPGSIVVLPNPGASNKQNDPGNLAHHLQHSNANDEIEAIETKFGITTGSAQTPVANTVLGGGGTGTSSWRQVATADLASAAVTQRASDSGSGDTNTGTSGTLANITSCVVSMTMTSGGGSGLAILTGNFTDTIDGTDISLALNITGLGDVGGVVTFAQQGANRRMLGVWAVTFTGLSGAVTFQARFGRAGSAGTLTAQATRLDVVEFKR